MITITKLGVGTAQSYYRTDFASASNRYYSQEKTLQGRWQGELAADLGLKGAVTDEQYDRLTNGQHPHTAMNAWPKWFAGRTIRRWQR